MKHARCDMDFKSIFGSTRFKMLTALHSEAQEASDTEQRAQRAFAGVGRIDFIEESQCRAYLLSLMASNFFLAKENFLEAKRILSEARLDESLPAAGQSWIAQSSDFPECFDDDQLSLDATGNLIGFNFDADQWVIASVLLAILAPLVRDESCILLQDDEDHLWKLEFRAKSLRIFRSSLPDSNFPD